jgi:hypothetical protein
MPFRWPRVPSFIKTGLDIQKLLGGDTHTEKRRQQSNLTSPILFFQNKESRLKIYINAFYYIRL